MRMLVRTHFLRSRTRKQGGREGKTCAALLHGDQAPGDHLGGADFFDVIELCKYRLRHSLSNSLHQIPV